MCFKFFDGRHTGGDRECFSTDRFPAFNIERGIANHDNFVAPDFAREQIAATVVGNAGDLVAFMMVIGKCTDGEAMPELVVGEFQFGAFADVAGEKADSWFGIELLQIVQEFFDTGKNCAPAGHKLLCQQTWIDIEKPAKVSF